MECRGHVGPGATDGTRHVALCGIELNRTSSRNAGRSSAERGRSSHTRILINPSFRTEPAISPHLA
jgi:hypothetical protein